MPRRWGPAVLPCSVWMLLSLVLLVCATKFRSGGAASSRERSPPSRVTAAGASAATSSGGERPAERNKGTKLGCSTGPPSLDLQQHDSEGRLSAASSWDFVKRREEISQNACRAETASGRGAGEPANSKKTEAPTAGPTAGSRMCAKLSNIGKTPDRSEHERCGAIPRTPWKRGAAPTAASGDSNSVVGTSTSCTHRGSPEDWQSPPRTVADLRPTNSRMWNLRAGSSGRETTPAPEPILQTGERVSHSAQHRTSLRQEECGRVPVERDAGWRRTSTLAADCGTGEQESACDSPRPRGARRKPTTALRQPGDAGASRRMSASSSRCHKCAVLRRFNLAYIFTALPMAVAGFVYNSRLLYSVGLIMLAGGIILEVLSLVLFRSRGSPLSEIVPFTAESFNTFFRDSSTIFSSFLLVACGYTLVFSAAIAASGAAKYIATGAVFMGIAILVWAFWLFPPLRNCLQCRSCRGRASTYVLPSSTSDTEAQTTHQGDEVEMLSSRPEASSLWSQCCCASSTSLAGCFDPYASLVNVGGASLALAAAVANDSGRTSTPRLRVIGYAGAAYMLFAVLATAIRGLCRCAATTVRSAARPLPQRRWLDPALTYHPLLFGLITCLVGFVGGLAEKVSTRAISWFPIVMLYGVAAIGVYVALLPATWIAWQCAGGAIPRVSPTERQQEAHTVEQRDRAGPTVDRPDGQETVELRAYEGTNSTASESDEN